MSHFRLLSTSNRKLHFEALILEDIHLLISYYKKYNSEDKMQTYKTQEIEVSMVF